MEKKSTVAARYLIALSFGLRQRPYKSRITSAAARAVHELLRLPRGCVKLTMQMKEDLHGNRRRHKPAALPSLSLED